MALRGKASVRRSASRARRPSGRRRPREHRREPTPSRCRSHPTSAWRHGRRRRSTRRLGVVANLDGPAAIRVVAARVRAAQEVRGRAVRARRRRCARGRIGARGKSRPVLPEHEDRRVERGLGEVERALRLALVRGLRLLRVNEREEGQRKREQDADDQDARDEPPAALLAQRRADTASWEHHRLRRRPAEQAARVANVEAELIRATGTVRRNRRSARARPPRRSRTSSSRAGHLRGPTIASRSEAHGVGLRDAAVNSAVGARFWFRRNTPV